jgi:hypothetical protein
MNKIPISFSSFQKTFFFDYNWQMENPRIHILFEIKVFILIALKCYVFFCWRSIKKMTWSSQTNSSSFAIILPISLK